MVPRLAQSIFGRNKGLGEERILAASSIPADPRDEESISVDVQVDWTTSEVNPGTPFFVMHRVEPEVLLALPRR
jgi:hypothetical protein